ncbi:MAG: hypothetical protein WB424_10305 [Terracidiphilus sp.]|jgi:hypothetical protein
MKRPKVSNIALDAFYDNFSCAALFGKLRIPGAPREIVDPRSLKEFSIDEIGQGVQDFKNEIERISALVWATPAQSLITKEALRSLLGSLSESSLKPLEKLQHS